MLKNSLYCIPLLLILSCSSKQNLVLIDEYYNSIYDLTSTRSYSVEVIDRSFTNFIKISKYKKVVVSPMIYKLFIDELSELNNLVVVINSINSNIAKNIHQITLSDEFSYSKLTSYFNEIKKIDYRIIILTNESDKKSMTSFINSASTMGDVTVYDTKKHSNKDRILRYIDNQKDVDLWIIDMSKFGLDSYNKIDQGDILMKFGKNLKQNDDRIKFSIEVDIKKGLNNFFRKDQRIIYSDLVFY